MKRWIKSSTNTPIDLSEYEWVSNVDGYQVYRKIVTDEDGSSRGVWVAQDQDKHHPPFSITYRQARGFEPITEYESDARRLGREIGQMLFGGTSIEAASYEYDSSMTYSRGGQRYRVYLLNESDPDNLKFAISEIHPYDDANYAWAMKNAPVSVAIIRNNKVEYSVPLPEWDWDIYDDSNEYVTECVDIACAALKEANS